MRSIARAVLNEPWKDNRAGPPIGQPFLVARRKPGARRIAAARRETATLFETSWPVLRFLLTPLALTAGALSIWRLGTDPGWTKGFFIAQGFLSHWQVWLAAAIGIQVLDSRLNRRVPARQESKEYDHDQE